ncbi:MAG: VOC family protein [Anaerolineae bacterium]|nr:VOC family protein [Anaerolineae bacterium]
MVAKDMAATLRFYRLLGMDIPEGAEREDHVETAQPGFRVAWDSQSLIQQIDSEWVQPVGQRIGIGFLCESPTEVDALYTRVTEAGYEGYKAPWDAFWGQRYAVVTDPDGNHVDLFAAL